ncbi:hypothetical protein ABZT03_23030 [Streptomyces sp. NPDC005574]|uniref:hypothetical protein n=1 Tax=Streptomyces sp. NPDC005574 TaxID=3156891 RepID=UPI0033A2EF30
MTLRSPGVAGIALTVAGVLSLSACGGADSPQRHDNDKVGAPAASTASTPAAVVRPRIELPSDVTYDFEWRKTGDTDKDAVLNDAEQRIRAVDMAIAEQKPLHAAYRFYSEGTAAAGSQAYIQEFVDHKARTTGLTRFYKESVTVKGDGTATLVYCEDQNRAFNRFLSTGKTDVTPVTKNNYVIYSSILRRSNGNVWVTEHLNSQRGSAKCRPA